jgi:hypothetical protein
MKEAMEVTSRATILPVEPASADLPEPSFAS